MTQTNKNIQDLFKTYVAKSDDEEKFRKAHVISTVDNNDKKLGPKDDQFVATTKTYERDSSHHGYNPGGDEKVYSEEVNETDRDKAIAHYKADLPNILKDIRGKKKSHSDLRREYGLSWKRLANSTADEHGHNYNRDHLLAVGKQHMEDHASQINEMSSKMKMKLGLYGKKKKMEEEVELDEAALKQAENRHFEKQLPKMQAAINLELRKGKDYQDAVAAARRHFKEEVDADLEDELKATRQTTKSIRGHSRGAMGRAVMKKERNLAQARMDRAARGEMKSEEVEQVDEVSKATLGRYINRAKDSIDMTSYRSGIKDGTAISSSTPYKSNNPLEKKLSKRHKGIETAVKKLTKEEAEQIDELSKKTLGSYVKKASGAERNNNRTVGKNLPITSIASYQGDSETGHFGKRFNQATYDKVQRLRKNRETGIKRAVDKMTNEEIELDEKKLTKAELAKREEVAAAMERENPGMDMSKKMAIATAQAKKVAEEVELDEGWPDRIVRNAISGLAKAKGYAQQAAARMRTVPPAPAGTPRLPAPTGSSAGQFGDEIARLPLPRNRSVVTTTQPAARASRINPRTAAAVAGGTALVGAGGAATYLATRDSSASAAPAAAKPAKATTAAAAPVAATTAAAAPAKAAAVTPAKTSTTAGNSSSTYKVKGVDVTQDVKDITKANPSITNPNMIRAGQKIKVGDSDYTVQKGDTLSGIAARRRSSAATPAATAPKAATDSTTPEAPKANDFSDVKSDSAPIAPKHDDHAQGYDNKSRKQIKADARAAIRTQRVLAKASKLQTTRGDDYSAAYANRKMADIAGDTEKAYGHEDQASAQYGKRAEYGRNMNNIRRSNSIAAAQANKVQEEIELGEAVNSDDAFDRLEKAGAKDVKTTSGGIRYSHGGKEYNLRHNMKRTGHRTVRSAELAQHLDRLQEEVEVVQEQFAPGRFKQVMVERALNTLDSYLYGENNLDD